ncbi:MAG TPA: ATPase, T2SS/T4P/T4SS family [Syntrophorhabdaceae bacterium]|jgi:type IV pilus assembly protein PilB|nr:Flp pilus assembly complex ATPase component TadA [Syntrophorhabdaceae bacterium]HOF56953.1 ATPase, T2SS/T4P/T4SS family [Syntrophorhabdaceae bacterium]HOS04533.1 ATPase, T2SS/T4P/T4SS family [Syntrophorhabdaceae bacterium]HPL40118.1 ATPase, T2SS/T4P/T4SS family [Syntrophorhabdaceae bacterium]
MNSCSDKMMCLSKTELFKSLSPEELQKLESRLKERVYPPNTAIVREGAPGDAMFIIKDGKVDVKKREQSTGIDMTIASLGGGACFGEMALLTGNPRSATVMATMATSVFVLEKKDFEALLRENPTISMSLNKIVAERVEAQNIQRGMGVKSLATTNIDADILLLIPKQTITRQKVLPISYANNTLMLGMIKPNDILAIDEVRKFVKGVAIEQVLISEDELKVFMEKDYPEIIKKGEEKIEVSIDNLLDNMDNLQSDILKDMEIEEGKEDEIGVADLESEAQGAPIVRLTNSIIGMALKKGASDIHIEPMEKGCRVRYRIDGMLKEEMMLPRKVILPLISRIKIISKLDITERRMPQDGRITMRIDNKSVDFRVSSVPTKFGEKICTRILDKSNTMLGLDKLISHRPTLDLIREMIAKPYGIIYVTGPTGSGKSTTLYSALAEKNSIDVNISTVEDPIEYDLAGINQVQVNSDIGLDFARVLRAFLRQDPDIILVGETRDKETAKIAVEAALTGHLVFTTLHANDAPSTFMRLNEMGIEPFLVSTSIIGIISQRLVRRICPNCKEKYKPDNVIAKYLELPEDTELYKGKGCDTCNMSGYKGRVGVYEVLSVNESLRHFIGEGADTQTIRQEAIRGGMRSLKDYCLILLNEGLTTVDEVLRTVAIQS